MIASLFSMTWFEYMWVQSQNDYMRDWIPRQPRYLEIILDRMQRPDPALCSVCNLVEASWRCLHCFGEPIFCSGCLRQSHHSLPFHRIHDWDGDCFHPAWLADVGVKLHLGHGGQPSPCAGPRSHGQEPPDAEAEALPDESLSELDVGLDDPEPGLDMPSTFGPSRLNVRDKGVCVAVDTSGIHILLLAPCECPTAEPIDQQCLRMGLYPASFINVKTVFTFQLLDDFRLKNHECHVSCKSYYEQLRRITSSVFPDQVPVRRTMLGLVAVGLMWQTRTDTERCSGLSDNGGISSS